MLKFLFSKEISSRKIFYMFFGCMATDLMVVVVLGTRLENYPELFFKIRYGANLDQSIYMLLGFVLPIIMYLTIIVNNYSTDFKNQGYNYLCRIPFENIVKIRIIFNSNLTFMFSIVSLLSSLFVYRIFNGTVDIYCWWKILIFYFLSICFIVNISYLLVMYTHSVSNTMVFLGAFLLFIGYLSNINIFTSLTICSTNLYIKNGYDYYMNVGVLIFYNLLTAFFVIRKAKKQDLILIGG